MDAKRTTDRPKIDTIDGKEIKKKIFNYAREYAFDKISKSLDKKMAKETTEVVVGGGNAVQLRRESKNALMLQRQRQYSDDDDYDDECDLVAMSTRESRQCQAYIANERRISGRHLQQKTYSQLMQQNITANRRRSSRISITPTQNSIVPGRATMVHQTSTKPLNHVSHVTINRTDNDENENYQTADDLDDAEDCEDYEDDSDDEQVILRDKKNLDGRPSAHALSTGQYYLNADEDYDNAAHDGDKTLAVGKPKSMNRPTKNGLMLDLSKANTNTEPKDKSTTNTTTPTTPGGSSAVDYSGYIQKKSFAQGMMDLALLSANTNQLRYILEYKDQLPYFGTSFALVCSSLFLQIAVGLSLIWNTRFNLKKRNEMKEADRANNFGVIGIFLVTLINVFLSTFSGSPGGGSATKETMTIAVTTQMPVTDASDTAGGEATMDFT